MNDYQLASLITGLVLLVAVGTRYFLSRPGTQAMRDLLLWAAIVALIGIGYGIYAAVSG
ncbi:MAG: hypothetical protein R3F55_15480 [Alphaproteobacteria bacterium]